MYRMSMSATLVAFVVLPVLQAGAAEPRFELAVQRDRLVGSSRGTLVFEAATIEYRTTNTADARRWTYDDIKQLQVLSPVRMAILTYEDQGRLKLGADRTFEFTVTGSTIPSGLVTFILERIAQPVVTAVMPESGGESLFSVRVKHQRRGRGSEGTLELHDGHLAYLTPDDGDGRYWRFGDIYAVLPLDRSRLQVTVYEGGGGRTRTLVFELKSDPPAGFYDALWSRVNAAALGRLPPELKAAGDVAGGQ